MVVQLFDIHLCTGDKQRPDVLTGPGTASAGRHSRGVGQRLWWGDALGEMRTFQRITFLWPLCSTCTGRSPRS